MFKKIVSYFLYVSTLFMLISGPLEANAALVTTPKSITNVSYKYNDRAKFLDLSGATVSGDSVKIPGAALVVGDIVVDKEGQNSLKILRVNADGTYITGKPSMIDLFSEFTIPRQIIEPASTNITEYAVTGISPQAYVDILATESGEHGTQKLMSGDIPSASMQKMYNLFEERGSKIYRYNGEYTFKSFDLLNPTVVKLQMDGALGVSPGLVADYSLFGGYEFGFVDAAQFIDLNVLIDAKIDKEMYCPVFSVDVPIVNLGHFRLGVYLVLNIDGDITLTVRAEEGVTASAYVHGGTKFGIPTSFHVDTEFDKFFGAECDPIGYIHAGVYLTPLVGLEILDVDVFNAQLRVGFYAYADITENTMSYGVDFVVDAFVIILDDRTDLINVHIPIIERNKSFRSQDDVIFYFSRLCTYQDRINVAAFTKRLSGTTPPNAKPFSDKLAFSNHTLELWYYAAGNEAQGGANQNPTKKVTVTTDENGCVCVDFKSLGIDIKKGDRIVIKAPGFVGQTDLIGGTSPFSGADSLYGYSALWGDFFEDTVEFETLSGKDLTVLDVPNSDVQFNTQDRIYYEGPVTVYSTNKTTHATEKAVFTADRDIREYSPQKTGLMISVMDSDYDIKPNCELRWQINDSGYVYGTVTPTGAGGHETTHHIVVRRLTMDQQVPIENYTGNLIGLQHNVVLQLIAVNKGGSRPYTGSADLYVALGEVPADFVQGAFPPTDLGYVKFPAANMRYPNHFEYYFTNPFPVLLYEKKDAPRLVLGSPDSSSEGTSTQAAYLWRWVEIRPDVPPTVTVTGSYTVNSPTGAPTTVYTQTKVPNNIYKKPFGMNIDAFSGVPTAYTVNADWAGASVLVEEEGVMIPRSIYQMRHIVSGMSVEGVAIPNPPFSPPAPIIYDLDELKPGDVNAFNIEFQLEQMMKTDRFVVNPLSEWASGWYKPTASVMKNTAVAPPVTIKNDASLSTWAREYIRSAVNNGIMKLDASGNFAAGKYTTRAEFCAAIVNALGLSALDTVKTDFPFTDVKSADPNLKQMTIAYQCGIINGISAKAFSPNSLITRQDAATMLMRAFSLRNSGLIPSDTAGLLRSFSDRNAVGGYATANLEKAVSLGFFSGYPDGTLLPLTNITNEQTAKILWELKLKAEKPGLQWG